MKYGAIAAGRVGTGKIHRVWTSRSGTLPDITVVAQRKEHEVVVEIVLPQEGLSLQDVGGETHVTGQSLAVDFHITSVDALQRHNTTTPVVDDKFRRFTLVAGMGVVQQAVLECYSRISRGFVDDAERLAVRDVAAAVGTRLVNGEVIEFCKTAVLSVFVESEEGMTRTLE